MALVNSSDFSKRQNKITKVIIKLAMKLLKADKLNKVYAEVADLRGNDVTAQYLLNQNIKYTVSENRLQNIPQKGGVIFIANHPTGALDGILLIDILSRVRPDVKFMGNFLLNKLENLNTFFIIVDPFSSENVKNITGIRGALEHLKTGGALVIFPAGEVSTFHKWFAIKDKKWEKPIVKFIRKAQVPIVPIYLSGCNSMMFHLLGLIHPIIRTAMLARELVNKNDTFHQVVVGAPIFPIRTSSLSEQAYSDFLRTNVYLLKEHLKKKVENNVASSAEPVRLADSHDLITDEIEKLKNNRLLFNQGSYSIIFAPPQELNHVIREIGRLREITFREVGEGTNQDLDIDKYDKYYHQLLIWDNDTKQIIGGYRLGMGAEFIEQKGIGGFYTHSLFRMSKEMGPVLNKTIELGRSFIIKDFQKSAIALMLLWKGIFHVLLKHENYRYLLGPVSISNTYSEISKTLIERYINNHHFDYRKAKFIKPLNPIKRKKRLYVKRYLKNISSIDLLDKLILDIEGNKQGVPILIKKYLQLNGKVISFNVDYNFSEVLDALMILDLCEVPESIIAMLSKDMGIDVYQRFKL